MTITPGSLEFMPTFYPWFITQSLSGIRLHVRDHRPYGQEIMKQETYTRVHIPEVIIEFGPTGTDYEGIYRAAEEAGESTRNYGVTARRGELPWLKQTRIDRLTIINHDTDYQINVDANFIEDDTPAPMHIELRGFSWIHKDAFDRVRGPLTLHLDPDPEGNPHRLHFSEAVETPAGTGFLPLWSKDAPYPRRRAATTAWSTSPSGYTGTAGTPNSGSGRPIGSSAATRGTAIRTATCRWQGHRGRRGHAKTS